MRFGEKVANDFAAGGAEGGIELEVIDMARVEHWANELEANEEPSGGDGQGEEVPAKIPSGRFFPIETDPDDGESDEEQGDVFFDAEGEEEPQPEVGGALFEAGFDEEEEEWGGEGFGMKFVDSYAEGGGGEDGDEGEGEGGAGVDLEVAGDSPRGEWQGGEGESLDENQGEGMWAKCEEWGEEEDDGFGVISEDGHIEEGDDGLTADGEPEALDVEGEVESPILKGPPMPSRDEEDAAGKKTADPKDKAGSFLMGDGSQSRGGYFWGDFKKATVFGWALMAVGCWSLDAVGGHWFCPD